MSATFEEAMRNEANDVCSIASSSSIMQTFFANDSCDPFSAESSPCLMGNYVDYAVNVASANDVIAAVNFAKKNNIRFVIRNTGHE
jgi:FAD/FMN-containing dehydrogenase